MLSKYLRNEGGDERGAQPSDWVDLRSKQSGDLCSFWVHLGQVLASLQLVLNVSQSAETNKLIRVCACARVGETRADLVWILGQVPFLACRETGASPLGFVVSVSLCSPCPICSCVVFRDPVPCTSHFHGDSCQAVLYLVLFLCATWFL